MLTFIDKTDYQKPTYEQISPTHINWQYVDNDGATHSGFFLKNILSNHTRIDDQTSESVSFEPFDEVLALGLVPAFDQATYDAKMQSEADLKNIEIAKQNRENLIAQSTVTVASGNVYHADKQSVVMLGNARQRLQGAPTDTIVKWSLHGTPAGFMSDVTHAEIIDAHNLAVDQLTLNWEI